MGMMWLVLTLATLVVHAAEMPEELSTAQRLKADVQQLAETIGDRSLERPEAREATRRYIEESLKASEIAVERTPYAVQIKGFDDPVRGVNLAVTFVGAELPDEYVIVGAHYDTVAGSPGADDNASGVAVLMELARRLASHPNQRTVRLIFFDLEEPPVFRTPAMGSWVEARACRQRGDDVVFMLALDGLGFYDDTPGSQNYPAAHAEGRPSTANFLALIGSAESPRSVRHAAEVFGDNTALPVKTLVANDEVAGVGWSDHWSFWQAGYPHAFLATDTLPLRYHHYHLPSDQPGRLDYDRMAKAVDGLEAVVRDAISVAD